MITRENCLAAAGNIIISELNRVKKILNNLIGYFLSQGLRLVKIPLAITIAKTRLWKIGFFAVRLFA